MLSWDYVSDVGTIGDLQRRLEGEDKLYIGGTWSCGCSSDVYIGKSVWLEVRQPCFIEKTLTCDVVLGHDLKDGNIFGSRPDKVHIVYVGNVYKLGNRGIASSYRAEILNSYNRYIAIDPCIHDAVKFIGRFPVIAGQFWCLSILWREDGLLRELNEDAIS